MNDSTTNKIEGALHELKGRVKEAVGHATANPDLEAEGTGEKLAGKVQKKIGEIETVVNL
jgi:uncharacterized protein YjbJ (UPF0337 family)